MNWHPQATSEWTLWMLKTHYNELNKLEKRALTELMLERRKDFSIHLEKYMGAKPDAPMWDFALNEVKLQL